jgi:NADPH:quinone reductase-like Zn-dependent oxidoreductase
MFSGPYGVSEDGTYSESIAVRREDLCLIPDNIDDATAAGMPVAYLTAQITLMQAGFAPGKIVLAPAIGGAVGNAVTQLARAQGAGKAISTTTSPAKAKRARALGFEHVIDLSAEGLADGVARITGGRGVDVVIESVGGALTGQALATLALNGVLTRQHERFRSDGTIASDQSDRMGRHSAAARLGSGQADRRTNVQAGRISRGTTPFDRRPSVRQSGSG